MHVVIVHSRFLLKPPGYQRGSQHTTVKVSAKFKWFVVYTLLQNPQVCSYFSKSSSLPTCIIEKFSGIAGFFFHHIFSIIIDHYYYILPPIITPISLSFIIISSSVIVAFIIIINLYRYQCYVEYEYHHHHRRHHHHHHHHHRR